MDVVVTIVENNFLTERLEKADYIVGAGKRLASVSLRRFGLFRVFSVFRGSLLFSLKSDPRIYTNHTK